MHHCGTFDELKNGLTKKWPIYNKYNSYEKGDRFHYDYGCDLEAIKPINVGEELILFDRDNCPYGNVKLI